MREYSNKLKFELHLEFDYSNRLCYSWSLISMAFSTPSSSLKYFSTVSTTLDMLLLSTSFKKHYPSIFWIPSALKMSCYVTESFLVSVISGDGVR
jgi:hypothetical protein